MARRLFIIINSHQNAVSWIKNLQIWSGLTNLVFDILHVISTFIVIVFAILRLINMTLNIDKNSQNLRKFLLFLIIFAFLSTDSYAQNQLNGKNSI